MTFLRTKKRKIIFIAGFILLLILLVLGVIQFFSQKPPASIIEASRKAISDARKEEANIYSAAELELAEKDWLEGMNEWKANNDKTSILRDYQRTIDLANRAIVNAGKARMNAIKRKGELHKEIETSLKSLMINARFIETVTGKLPVNHGIRKKFTPVKLKLDEIQAAFNRNDLISARKELTSTQKSITSLKQQATDIIRDYFSSYPEWLQHNEQMRQWSAKHRGVSLLVDKFSRRCIVYKSGKNVKEFEVELGVNWLGNKVQKGDRATPEGTYSIVAKNSGSKTKYHKALLINFPNAEDKQRFAQQKARGNISGNALLGGSIEIHGGGGKGIDWTDGCIALSNKDMDNLFSLCSVGTPIAIVGSLVPLEKVFEEIQN